ADDRPLAGPAAVEAGGGEGGDAPLGELAGHPVRQRVPEERWDVVLRLAEHRLRVDREPAVAVAEQVVMVEVAVDERVAAALELRVQLGRERRERMVARVAQPVWDVIVDRPEGRRG